MFSRFDTLRGLSCTPMNPDVATRLQAFDDDTRTKLSARKKNPAFHRPATQCRAMNSRTICAATAAVCPESNGATST